jgi:hypothetical protein
MKQEFPFKVEMTVTITAKDYYVARAKLYRHLKRIDNNFSASVRNLLLPQAD